MRNRAGVLAWLVVLSTALHGQQPEAKKSQGYEPIVIYRIDLVPTGSIFSMDEPKLDGEKYVFRILPERTLERLSRERVKKITRRTRDFEKEVVFRVEFEPTGQMLVSDEPVKKGSNYLLNAWKGGTLLSVGQADVKKITRLTGMDAFRAEEEELGVVLLEGEVNFRPDGTQGAPAGPGSQPAPGPKPAPGNWTYQGAPGQTDAYAPASGTVARPGDVPKAPEPPRPPN